VVSVGRSRYYNKADCGNAFQQRRHRTSSYTEASLMIWPGLLLLFDFFRQHFRWWPSPHLKVPAWRLEHLGFFGTLPDWCGGAEAPPRIRAELLRPLLACFLFPDSSDLPPSLFNRRLQNHLSSSEGFFRVSFSTVRVVPSAFTTDGRDNIDLLFRGNPRFLMAANKWRPVTSVFQTKWKLDWRYAARWVRPTSPNKCYVIDSFF
jgi:hypothetical protein